MSAVNRGVKGYFLDPGVQNDGKTRNLWREFRASKILINYQEDQWSIEVAQNARFVAESL